MPSPSASEKSSPRCQKQITTPRTGPVLQSAEDPLWSSTRSARLRRKLELPRLSFAREFLSRRRSLCGHAPGTEGDRSHLLFTHPHPSPDSLRPGRADVLRGPPHGAIFRPGQSTLPLVEKRRRLCRYATKFSRILEKAHRARKGVGKFQERRFSRTHNRFFLGRSGPLPSVGGAGIRATAKHKTNPVYEGSEGVVR